MIIVIIITIIILHVHESICFLRYWITETNIKAKVIRTYSYYYFLSKVIRTITFSEIHLSTIFLLCTI